MSPDRPLAPAITAHPVVQFYDARSTVPSPPFTAYGQLVASYRRDPILPGEQGITLRAGVPVRVMDSAPITIRSWLREHTSR